MKRYSFLAVVLAVSLTGCASVRTIPLDGAPDDAFAEINEQGQRQDARITLSGRPAMTALRLQVAPDTTSWRDPRTDRLRTVATAEVREILFKQNRMVKGIAVGAGFAVALALAVGEDCGGRDDDEECIGRIDLVPAFALIGGIIGGIIGSRGEARYRFEASPGPQTGRAVGKEKPGRGSD